ncbi:MAG: sensor histidine kinase [Gammaproteobacteria bacterium]|jgi:signal transduction histidine kinase/ABC-type amino acid transport substrate-binding protein
MFVQQKQRCTYRFCRRCIFGLLILILPVSISVAETVPSYKIGVLAFRGEDNAMGRWQATADYLNRQIEDARFVVVPMGLDQLRRAVEQQSVDFVLTNTGQYVEFEVFYGVSRIATVKNNIDGVPSTLFGAVVFTRAERDDIRTIEDIKGKHFMAVKRTAFGGFQMAWREMLRHGVDPFTDLASLEFSGFPQDNVVYAVKDGTVDVGTVRSETLEQMDREGKIDLNDFKVLEPKHHPAYKMLHSTPLYPVWPFARLKHTSRVLSERVASALLRMPGDSEAARAAHIMGWTIPVDYQPVHELMRELRVGPYAGLDRPSWKQLVGRYWLLLTVTAIALLLLTVLTLGLRTTNRKLRHAQAKLQNQQWELVDTVHARTADLVVMRDQALEASEAKSAFLSKVSHELRTPLNAIIGYTDIMVEQLKDNTGKIDLKDMEKVHKSAVHLFSIISDLLDFTRLEHGTARLANDRFSISKLTADVMSRLQVAALKNGNHLELRNHLTVDLVETDRRHLQNALEHVLDNACKYTSEGTITLDIEQQPLKAGTLLNFRVCDNGIGISPEQQERIFNVFVQGDDSATRRFDGLGLGLAKSRGYCRLMGGDITLKTEPGKGSEFTISVPVQVVAPTSCLETQ